VPYTALNPAFVCVKDMGCRKRGRKMYVHETRKRGGRERNAKEKM
jgi:hypothetical protein